MTDYSKYTLTDFKAMNEKEFEQYVQMEYKTYIAELRHSDDYMTYSEFYRETEAMMGRRSSSYYI